MTSGRREQAPPSADEPSTTGRPLVYGPYEDRAGWLRGLGIALAVGGFLALSGAFADADASLGRRLAYWLPMMGIGALWGGFIARAFFPDHGDEDAPLEGMWVNCLWAALAMAVPFTGLVWTATWLVFGDQISWRGLPYLFGSVFVLSLAMTVLNTLVESRSQAMRRLRAAPPPVKPVSGAPAAAPARRRPPRHRGRGSLSAPAHLEGSGPDPHAAGGRHRRVARA